MTILVIGRPDSGKSGKAEELAMELSEKDNRIYLATMIPYGEEGIDRVRKHRLLREGKGFLTVERPKDITGIIDEEGNMTVESERTFMPEQENGAYPGAAPDRIKASSAVALLECVSNLCANEMFEVSGDSGLISSEAVVSKVTGDIRILKDKVKDLVIVTNEFETEEGFDEETVRYVNVVREVNLRLKELSERIYDITEGTWKIYEDH